MIDLQFSKSMCGNQSALGINLEPSSNFARLSRIHTFAQRCAQHTF